MLFSVVVYWYESLEMTGRNQDLGGKGAGKNFWANETIYNPPNIVRIAFKNAEKQLNECQKEEKQK